MKTLFVVSANLPRRFNQSTAGPTKDYVALIRRLGADVLDRSSTRRMPAATRLERVFGTATAQAWVAAKLSRRYDAILTDGEHIGIPLAALLSQAGARIPLVTLGHRLSAPKKRPFFRWLKIQRRLHVILHSSYQYEVATRNLGFGADRLALIPYQVDTSFWRPLAMPEERVIVSAGLEYRDYPTLFQAVAGLDARVVIGAASHWSQRPNTALSTMRPPNVEVGSFDYCALREQYARAAMVVVPLFAVDFQAGVTTILEAMAMGKAVIVTHTLGQTDVVVDRRAEARGGQPWSFSLLRAMAEQEDVPLEPNGLYVPADDPAALRRAIVYLLGSPRVRRQLGAAGRRTVERLTSVDQFADRVARVVERAATGQPLAKPAGWALRRVV